MGRQPDGEVLRRVAHMTMRCRLQQPACKAIVRYCNGNIRASQHPWLGTVADGTDSPLERERDCGAVSRPRTIAALCSLAMVSGDGEMVRLTFCGTVFGVFCGALWFFCALRLTWGVSFPVTAKSPPCRNTKTAWYHGM